jgi:hypothetical protein
VLGCFLIAAFAQFRPGMVDLYLVLAAASCLIVTKDEFVHSRECKAGEQWLHALLFVMHPLVLGAGFLLWVDRVGVIPEAGIGGQYVLSSLWARVSVGPWTASLVLYAQCAAVGLFLLYQVNHYVLLGRGKRRNSSNFKEPTLEAAVPASAQAENHGDLIKPPRDADGKGIL